MTDGKKTSHRALLVTLLITHACNLRCKYCYVRSYDSDIMSTETAKLCIADAFKAAGSDFDRIEFAFLGGEPFCAFDRMREICEWTWSQKWPLPYLFSASTNGTILSSESRRWLIENHARFSLSLSYDGEIGAQDHNRCQSNSKIDLSFFHRLWPDVPVKMTITEDNVGNLFDNIRQLHKMGIQVNDTFADGVPPWRDASLAILDQQLQMLCDDQLNHSPKRSSDLLSVDVTGILSNDHRRLFSCEAGISRITYDCDGSSYGCHLLSPLVLSDKQLSDLPHRLTDVRSTDDKCFGCALDSVCPSCEGNNYRICGNCWTREEKTCKLFRHQLYFACVYQMKTILYKNELTENDKLRYRAIVKVLKSVPMKEVIAQIQSNLIRKDVLP